MSTRHCACGNGIPDNGMMRCPACGPRTAAAPRRFWLVPAAAAGVTLLLMIGLIFLVIHTMRNSAPWKSTAAPVAVDSPSEPLVPPNPSEAEPAPDRPTMHLALPSEVKPPARPAGEVTIAKVEPTVPAAPPADRTKPVVEFFQELVVVRQSAYRVLDNDFSQNVQYAFLSRFTVEESETGVRQVQQKVEEVRLGNADLALREKLNELLKKTRGAHFTMTVSPAGEVTTFAGPKEAIAIFGQGNPLAGQGFVLWSFMDQDAWKEMAQVAFFQPEQPPRTGAKWSRKLEHNWGPLGRWSGTANYAFGGRPARLDRYTYELKLAYKPPQAGGGGLPFDVSKADFKILTATGAIDYDSGKGRVSAAEERFHVRGSLAITALGTTVPLIMDEAQVFRMRLHDKNPWGK